MIFFFSYSIRSGSTAGGIPFSGFIPQHPVHYIPRYGPGTYTLTITASSVFKTA